MVFSPHHTLFQHSLLTALYKQFLKIDVFSFTLDAAVIIDVNVKCCVTAFHRLGAVTLKVLSPWWRLVRGTQ